MSGNQSYVPWSPLFFLSALGAGGMMVTFFMFLLFWVPHPGQPIPVFEDIVSAFTGGSVAMQAGIAIAVAGILFFAVRHFQLLFWNLSEYRHWKAEGGLKALEGTNAHTQILAMPLTLAMSINGSFILGAVLVPNLWSVVEFLFPLAMTGFLALGVFALKTYIGFFSHVVSENSFKTEMNASFAQLLPGFSFAMIAVGLAAPAAMSHSTVTVAASVALSGFFLIPAVFLTLVKLVLGVGHMLEHGVNRAALPTLWVGVPILTTVSIAMLRLDHGLAHTLGVSTAGQPFFFLTLVLAAQLFLMFLGYTVMKRMGYLRDVQAGKERSPLLFALICPGVGLSVVMQFYINKGLVAAGVVAKFGVAYWSLTALAIAAQLVTAYFLIKLTRELVCTNCRAPKLATA